jgi:hypothetical protein
MPEQSPNDGCRAPIETRAEIDIMPCQLKWQRKVSNKSGPHILVYVQNHRATALGYRKGRSQGDRFQNLEYSLASPG